MFSTYSEPAIFMYWTSNSVNNLLSYCGLVDATIRAFDKDLPVAGDKIIIQPDLEFAVKNMDNWNKLEFENTSKRLVTYIKMKNISKNVIQLYNGEEFGIVRLVSEY